MTVEEYPGISFRYSLLTTSHLSNFTLPAPHALHARNSILSGHRPLDRRRRSLGVGTPEVPRLCVLRRALAHPPTRETSEGSLLRSSWPPPPAWFLHSPSTTQEALPLVLPRTFEPYHPKDRRTEVYDEGNPLERPVRKSVTPGCKRAFGRQITCAPGSQIHTHGSISSMVQNTVFKRITYK